MSPAKNSTKRVLTWIVVIVGIAAIAVASRGWSFLGPDETASLSGSEVRRGNLVISVTERGNLVARNSVSLRSEIEGRTTILGLVEEGTVVKEGDEVAWLDASSLVDQRVQQDISVQNAEAAFIKAEEGLAIQLIQNESDIAQAQQQLTFARQDLEKYKEGDLPQLLQEADEDIVLAEEELKRADEQLKWSTELFDKGFVQRTELEGDELSRRRASITLERAERSKRLLQDFDQPKQHAIYTAAVEEAVREVRRTELQAASRLVDFQTAVRTSKSKLDLEREKLAKLERQIQKSTLVAPVGGMVVYGREEGGRMRGDAPVSVGGEVRERQEIISIPGAGGMLAQASIHESVLKQVRPSLRCLVRVDAIPGSEFSGTVTFVAPLPDQNSWWANPNLRVYRAEIAIIDPTAEMRPGMSCSIEILIDELNDVLFVPLQAVTNQRGKNLAFVRKGSVIETREVEVGPHNNKWVSVASGLEQGEVVLLSPPPGFELRRDGDDDLLPGEAGSGEEGESPAAGSGAPPGMPKVGGDAPRGPRMEGGGERPAGGRPGGERGGSESSATPAAPAAPATADATAAPKATGEGS